MATLLKTKLYIPPPRPNLVVRNRLLKLLDAGLHRKLTLVSAPPGFGKTTLLSDWIHQHTPLPDDSDALKIAWLSLDEQDNDTVRFWSYAITALDNIQPGLGVDALTLLTETQAPPITDTLTTLINAAIETPAKLILVLDDYHQIEASAIHESLTFLIDNMPPQLHIMMTSRSDPPLPLTRLRVRGQLTELRDTDLRFTPAEAAIFLNQVMGINLSAEHISALETRTEGWVAGLQLAALSMQGRNNVDNFVAAFTGSHRYVIDYLAEEVLNQQPPHLRQFLLRTAVLDRLCGPLCDALLADSPPPADSQELLETLEQANLFLIPLDDNRRWYRYHHLFADFLREHLHQTSPPQLVARLHHSASQWHAQNGTTTEAISHALAAGETDTAVSFIEQKIIDVLTRGEVTIVQSWLKALPDALIKTRPRLSLAQGWTLAIINRWDEMEPWLHAAEAGLAEFDTADSTRSQGWGEADIRLMRGEVAAMRAMFEGNMGADPAKYIELCQRALDQLPEDSAVVRGIILMTMGNGYERLGDLETSSQILAEAVENSLQTDDLIVTLTALSNLGHLQEDQGYLRSAAGFYQRAIRIVDEKSAERRQPFPAARWAYIELAELYREWNQLEEAKRLLTIAFEMKRQLNMLGGNLSIAYIILARILQAEGDINGALDAIAQARQTIYGEPPVVAWIEAIQARLWLAQGNVSAAVQWARTSQLNNWPGETAGFASHIQLTGEYGTLARVHLAQEQFDEALEILGHLETGAKKTGRLGRLVEILALKALVEHARGNSEAALPLLAEAVALSEPGGYIRTFADEGLPMRNLLQAVKLKKLLPNPTHLNNILAACGGAAGGQSPADQRATTISTTAAGILIEPLSDRELEVLQLVAEGLSNREIADRLFITVGTAKTHTINIYRKLDVNSRTQAVARAQELGLF